MRSSNVRVSTPTDRYCRLETFNQIAYHQFSNNANLIYAILRSHKRFEDLGTFTLAKGLREIQRIKRAKEDAERIKTGQGLDKGKSADIGLQSLSPAADSPTSRLTSLDEGSVEKIPVARTSSEAATRLSREEDTDGQPIPVPPTPTAGTERSFSSLRLSSPPPALSEKARGKLKEGSQLSAGELELDPELERLAAAGVGRNGFVPTQEWVSSWQQG